MPSASPAPLLDEPTPDPQVAAADRALAEALAARLALGASASHDGEALALRALLAEAHDSRQASVIQAVWGRISAGAGAPVIAAEGVAQVWAADRYGQVRSAPGAPDALLAEAERGLRVMLPLDDPRAWWARLLARPALRIVAALPDDRYGLPQAGVVSNQPTGPTGEDRTFWVTDSALPDDRILAALNDSGLTGRRLTAAGGLKLFLLAGYVQAEDGRLATAPGRLQGVIGAASVF